MPGTGGFINPENIINNLSIQLGSKVADFGSGSGYFTILLARAVGPDGTVNAIDVLETALNTIKSKALADGFLNINYIRANLEVLGSTQLKDDSQDTVLLANILFQSQMKEKIIEEAKRVLKSGGDLVMIDWDVDSVFGPSETGWKITKEDAQALVNNMGFSLVKDLAVASHHWGLLLRKN